MVERSTQCTNINSQSKSDTYDDVTKVHTHISNIIFVADVAICALLCGAKINPKILSVEENDKYYVSPCASKIMTTA